MTNWKYTVILSFITLVILPFIFLTDFFPFFRFGMFAEPVKQETQTEKFFVTFSESANTTSLFNPETVGISESSFQYMLRNYYYRGESKKLLSNLKSSCNKPTDSWKLFRVIKAGTPSADTLQTYSLE
ncbi:MAG TPA: hypothetical protein VIK89_11070 [Cytophagaceae bacterium]